MENKNISVEKIIEICQGTVLSSGAKLTSINFCVDTRKLQLNNMFVLIKSEQKEGLEYINEAFEKGAIGCITQINIPKEIIKKYNNKIIIKVNDVIDAIQKLAKYKRSLYKIPVVAITGSVGKTTTKDIIAKVLEKEFKVAKTQGNYNNHIGVPITILNWKNDTTAAVVEMGMNHFGEIKLLTKIAKPTVAVITNIGTAHIGILGSRENILKAKLEILDDLEKDGTIIINNDNDLLNQCNTKDFKKITYGINNKSNYVAYNITKNNANSEYNIEIDKKEEKVFVPVAGEHFIFNSLCAIAVGKALGMNTQNIINGISNFEITGKRNEIIEINNIKIINDYYNASYDSMKASLEVLSNMIGERKIAILGDMLELGTFAEELHRKVGKEVIKNNIDILFTVGILSKDIAKEARLLGLKNVYEFETNEECINKIKEIIKKDDCILLKASNRMNFCEISNYLQGEQKWN